MVREAFFRAKLVCDNLGRLPGDLATLAGILYPAAPPSAAKMRVIVAAWVKAGLASHYRAGRAWFIEICDTGATQRLVGNMSARSDFPPPPERLIRAWERRFGLKWQPVGRAGKESEIGIDTYKRVQTRIAELGRVGLGQDECRAGQGSCSSNCNPADCNRRRAGPPIRRIPAGR